MMKTSSPECFLDPHVRFAIRERADRCLPEGDADVLQILSAKSRLAEPVRLSILAEAQTSGAPNLGARKRRWQSSKLARSGFSGE